MQIAESPGLCAACGGSVGSCACIAVKNRIEKQAIGFRRRGIRAANFGYVVDGRRLLMQSASRDPGNATTWKALGLCAFCLGHVEQARKAWEQAASIEPSGPASRWLEDLSGGELGTALVGYREALKLAAKGDLTAAASRIAAIKSQLPGFSPAARLEGLILAAQGRASLARQTWLEQMAAIKDDPDLLRLLAEPRNPEVAPDWRKGRATVTLSRHLLVGGLVVLVGISAFMVGRISNEARAPGLIGQPPATSDVSGPSSQDSAGVSRSAKAATSTSPARAMASPQQPDGLKVREGWQLYRKGRNEFKRRDWNAALPLLVGAIEGGGPSFYHDDALYLLAQTYRKVGNQPAARETAARLLSEHPTSMFANSVTGEISQLGQAKAP